jgi:hypothetical protein
LDEVVDQANPIALQDWQYLVFTVGIECGKGELGRIRGAGGGCGFTAGMTNTEGPSAMGRWER